MRAGRRAGGSAGRRAGGPPARWALLALLLATGVGGLVAQRRERSFDVMPNVPYDGKFTFVRLRYTVPLGGRGFDQPWFHDYPDAEVNFGTILSELSLTPTHLGGGNVLDLDDPDLFKYPIAYMSEPGFWTLTPSEAAGFRAWLQKGGFVIFDDFGGYGHWRNFEARMREVLPDGRLVRLDSSHPIFDSFFRIESLEIESYRGISEFWGIHEDNDPTRRLMVIAAFNADIGDFWEWSHTDFAPIELTNEAYKLGVNFVVYAMTH